MFIPELTAALNQRFGTSFTENQIRTATRNHRIRSGRNTAFSSGHKPWNNGTKGLMKPNSGNFVKGATPPNRRALWSERICSKDGLILIKVPERDPHTGFPTRFKHKHVWLWEQAYGPVPEGMVVAFRDSDRLNCQLDNLMLISRTELLHLNLHNYRDQLPDLKPTVLALVKLEVKAKFRSTGKIPGAGRKKKQVADYEPGSAAGV